MSQQIHKYVQFRGWSELVSSTTSVLALVILSIICMKQKGQQQLTTVFTVPLSWLTLYFMLILTIVLFLHVGHYYAMLCFLFSPKWHLLVLRNIALQNCILSKTLTIGNVFGNCSRWGQWESMLGKYTVVVGPARVYMSCLLTEASQTNPPKDVFLSKTRASVHITTCAYN